MSSNDDLMRLLMATFADEAKEQLQAINQKLLVLERGDDDDRDRILQEIFREAHSLKGASRAVDLGAVEGVAHELETIFGRIQDGTIAPHAGLFDLAYRALDAMGTLIEAAVEGDEADLDVTELTAELSAVAAGDGAGAPVATVADSAPAAVAAAPVEAEEAPAAMSDDDAFAFLGGAPASEPVAEPATTAPADEAPPALGDDDAFAFLGGVAEKAAKETPKRRASDRAGEETVRVATAKLDALMAQVGELLAARIGAEQRLAEVRELLEDVIEYESGWRKARPQLRRALSQTDTGGASLAGMPSGVSRESTLAAWLEQSEESLAGVRQKLTELRRRFDADSRRVAQVTTDLQDDVRRTRMLPVSTVFDTFPRMVRDVARELDKQVSLVIEGGETEVDRSVLEQLKAPLTHMIRNSVDHGLETTADRAAAGKGAEGTVTLRASQRGANLQIEVVDDGAGIDVSRVRAKAVENGLLSKEAADALSDREALWLIFRAGFSTKAAVTDLSGRGVGMDVVREAVERMHGMIDVKSTYGAGSQFTISLPVSVATTRCLLVQAAGHTFALPITNVDRIVRLDREDIATTQGREAIRVDGRPTALARLADVLGVPGGEQDDVHAKPAIVLGSAERRVAFLIDGLLGAQEIAMKSLPRPFVRLRHVAGASILGTGEIVPILNAADLMRSTGGSGRGPAMAPAAAAKKTKEAPALLVVDDSMTIRTLNKNILEAAGYRVTVASDGAEAWAKLQAGAHFDLVVSDVEMPNMNGRELTEHVRADDDLKHLPVVLVTSLDSAEDRERGVAAGADAYIVKGGFDQDKLLETVGRLI